MKEVRWDSVGASAAARRGLLSLARGGAHVIASGADGVLQRVALATGAVEVSVDHPTSYTMCATKSSLFVAGEHWIERLSPRTLAVLEPRFLWPTHRFDGFLAHPESDLFILLDERVVAIRLATASGR